METSAYGRRTFLTMVGLSLLGAATRVRADGEPIAVVVSVKSAQKELTMSTLRRIFMNQPTDDDGHNRFLPINAVPKSPLRTRFDQVVLGMDADEIGRYWVDQRIRGVQAPRVVPELGLLRAVIAKWPGAIGYLPVSQVGPELRVLAIDGKLPSAVSYALR
jgi:ABC-type phosphate transport system substrate-binding protein